MSIGFHFMVDCVGNGVEALRHLEKQPSVDLILLDLNMPIMNGYDTLRNLKLTETYKDIPVYILSTSTNENDLLFCTELGAKGFVPKPPDFNLLCQKLMEVFNNELS